MRLDPTERAVVEATQAGLPRTERPFATVGERLGLTEAEELSTFEDLSARGVVRRIALAPNHCALGMTANGMTVWDVADDAVDRLGEAVSALPFVSHCYRRPRRLPARPYNLFAMAHGSTRAEVEAHRASIRTVLGAACRGDAVLYSTRIVEKTATVAHMEFDRHGRFALVSVSEDDGAVIVYDAATLEEVTRLAMRKPSGKDNVGNRGTFADGTSYGWRRPRWHCSSPTTLRALPRTARPSSAPWAVPWRRSCPAGGSAP
ncbi:MAG: cytochrome D1 domain-containing protein [Roseicyclus sp.]